MAKQILQGGGEYFDTADEINAKLEPIKNDIAMLDNEIDTLSKDTVSLSKTTTQTLKSPLSITNDLMINGDTNAFKIEVNENGSALLNSNDLIFDKLPKTNDETSYDDLADNQLVTKKMVKEQSSGGSSSINDKYGIQADYATHYGILDCPNGLIDTNITNKTITINPGIVLKLAGADGKTVLASKQTYDIEESGKLTLFLAKTSDTQLGFLEAGEVFYQEEEPSNGVTSYLAWWKPSRGKWQFKSIAIGDVWRETVATPIANITINESNTGVLNIDYIGYRILDDDIIAQMSDIDSIEDKIQTINTNVNTLSDTVDAYGYLINQDRQEITNLKNNKADKTSLGTMANKDASDYSTTIEANSLYASKTLEATVNTLSGNVEELTADVEANSQDIAGFINELENKADKSTIPTKTSQLVNDSNYTNKVYVDGEIAKIKQFNYTIVSTLPATGQADTIYLVSKTGGTTGDVYDEYMWINNKWELIGTTAVDLTGYATTTDLNDAINAEIAARENADNALQTSINGKANKATTLSGYGITNAYTKTETNNLLADKQNQLVAGSNIAINGTTISATDTKYTAGTNISIDSNNTIKCDIAVMKGATSTAMGAGGLVPTPRSGENTKYLRGDGTWYTPTNTTYSNFIGATTTTAGRAGLVPAPSGGYTQRYLKGDGTWGIFPEIKEYTGGTDIEVEDDGTISFIGNKFTTAEKTKLSGIATGAQVNKIETIAVNGTNQTITNKRVNITVPTKTSQLTNNSGFITQATADGLYVSKAGYYPYSQKADEALVKTGRWNTYSSIEPLPVNTSLFYEPINTNASGAVIQDTLGRLIRISRIGHICYFEMDLRFIGNVSAGFRSIISEGFLDNYMPLNKYTRFPAQIHCESDISYSQALEVYVEINKENNCIYLYNNLVLNANVLRAPRIICNGSYISSSILES